MPRTMHVIWRGVDLSQSPMGTDWNLPVETSPESITGATNERPEI